MIQTATEVLEIKAAVRRRDGNRCTECGMTGEAYREKTGLSLDVHRLTPGSPYSIDGCVTLCRSCHGPKPRRPLGSVGIKEEFVPPLALLVRRRASSLVNEVNRAVRELLEREGLWPLHRDD